MTNEEIKARIEALTGLEDAYALAKECGFPGTMEDFKAECAKVAGNGDAMDLDAMDSVAGGTRLMADGVEYEWLTQSIGQKLGTSMDLTDLNTPVHFQMPKLLDHVKMLAETDPLTVREVLKNDK